MTPQIPWDLVNTPDPNIWSFSHSVDVDKVWPLTKVGNDGHPIEGVTLYKNWILKEPSRVKGALESQWGNHVFFDSKTQGGVVTYIWAHPKSGPNGEDLSKVPFRQFTKKFGNHHWPPILKALTLREDSLFKIATQVISGSNQGLAVANRYYQQEDYVNDVEEGSRFVWNMYFGPRQFRIGRFPVPMPGRVAYQTVSSSGSFPECLHDDIEIPPTRTATSQNVGGTTTEVGGSLDGQFFPATPFRSWRPYVAFADQERQEGGWFLLVVRVYPPSLPRRIRQNS